MAETEMTVVLKGQHADDKEVRVKFTGSNLDPRLVDDLFVLYDAGSGRDGNAQLLLMTKRETFLFAYASQ